MRAHHSTLFAVAAFGLLASCGSNETEPTQPKGGGSSGEADETDETAAEPAEPLDFAIAIHGGAGAPPRDLDPKRRRAYVQGMASALRLGCDALDEGKSSLDVVEKVIRELEDDPQLNAGRGAVLTREGRHELDASIMDGRDLSCGAVAAVRTVKHPISLARKVMEETRHVLLSGDGAESFAAEMGMEPVKNDYFTTELRVRQWKRRLRSMGIEPPERGGKKTGEGSAEATGDEHGTVGAVALDRDGHLAAATSTGGLTAKRWGRIGDSPIIGAGTYAADDSCAVSCTGTGEEFIRHGIARMVAARMQLEGENVQTAAEKVIGGRLDEGDGGVIAVSHTGRIALVYNTGGMFRGACDADGRFDVRIWEEAEELPQGAR